MQPRRIAPFLLVPLAATLVACSSDGDSKSKDTAPAGTSTAAQSPEAVALTKKLQAGVATLRSAHFFINGTLAGEPLNGAGDQRLSGGKLDALNADVTLPGGVGRISVVVINGKAYAKLPPSLSDEKKPWVVISSKSANIVVQQVSDFVEVALTAASVGNLGELTSASTTVVYTGSATVGAVLATHYLLTVDPSKLPGSVADSDVLGTKPIPVDLYLDLTGRPVKVRAKLTVSDQPADITIVFSKFDEEVTVSAPPANLIAPN